MEEKEDSQLNNQNQNLLNDEEKEDNNNLLKGNDVNEEEKISQNENENNVNEISKETKDKNDEELFEEKEKEAEKEDETTNEYIFRCEKCHLVPIIKIDHKTYKIQCKCQNGHIKTNIYISNALNEYKQFSIKKCSLCEETSDEGNYICIQCQKIFCLDNGCKKKHLKENTNHKLIDIDAFDTTCFEHFTSVSKYCKDCKKNICMKCQRAQHGGHKLIDLGEVLPIPEEIENGKKVFEKKKEKLLKLKNNINEWIEDFNKRVKHLLDSIDAELIINENILKKFKTDLMNYQMIENFNYFSSKENLDIYSCPELMSFDHENNWLPKTFFIAQTLKKLEQPIDIKDETEDKKTDKNNIKNKNDYITDDGNLKINDNIKKNNNLKKTGTTRVHSKEKDNIKFSLSSTQLELKNRKTITGPLFPNNALKYGKDFYWSLNETKNKSISKKLFKSNFSLTENIYSGLIDNKGIIFLGSDSCLNIYRFDMKSLKIEPEFTIKGFEGAVNTILEVKDDLLVVGTSTCIIKIIDFLGNKKYRIHQEIRNEDKNSIYKIIELSNYYLMSCDEKNIVLLKLKKNNYYEVCQTINLDTQTCCVLQISDKYIAASHIALNKISIYEFNKKQLNLLKQIDNIELTFSNNSMTVINDKYFCSISKKNVFIISSEQFDIVKKVELKINITNIFPVSYDMILLCHCKENNEAKFDYSLSLKEFSDKNKELLTDFDLSIVKKNNDDIDDIFYLNFFNPNYMVIISQSTISIWG